MKRKVVLTCAVTGDGPLHPKFDSYPVTPKQIAESSLKAAAAGASVIHLHARDPETAIGSREPALYTEVMEIIRNVNPDVVINVTTGMGASLVPDPQNESIALPQSDMATAEERLVPVKTAGPEICTLDVTTMNLDGGIAGAPNCVYMNTPGKLREMAGIIKSLGVRPEIEVFNPGDILLARKLIEDGCIEGTPLFQFCLGVKWGAPADVETMVYMRNLLPAGAVWSAFGISRWQMPIVAASAIMGGNCRVGLEDNIYLERGVFATNEELVVRAKTIIESVGCDVATPEEAREILEIKGQGKQS